MSIIYIGKRFNETKIRNCNENSNKGYLLEDDVEYPKYFCLKE